MAHFARLDENNVVTQVVVIDNKDCQDALGVEKEHIGAAFCEKLFGGYWKQTSYNRSFRKNYAGVGYSYSDALDAFVPPKPYPSWVIDAQTAQWVSPVEKPDDNRMYGWDESTGSWVPLELNNQE